MQDAMIVQLYWDRDENAIYESNRKYGAYCNSVAFRILHNREDCEECVSDTWLRAWNVIPPQRPLRLKMFFAKIIRNLAFDRYRAQTAEKRGGEVETVLYELAECIAGNEMVEDRMIAVELGAAINRFVYSLNRRDGNIFVRRYFFGEPIADIGTKYDLSSGNVMTILSRTRKKLREYLEKEGYLP